MNPRKLHFLEAFLQMLLFKESPPIDASEEEGIDRNHLQVARRGRTPGLTLERQGRSVPLRDWAAELLDGMLPVCEWLDAGHSERPYTMALRDQLAKIQEPERIPSARLLAELELREESFAALALRVSREHREQLCAQPPDRPERWEELQAQAEESLQSQSRLESRQRGGFEPYLRAYLAD